MEGNSAGYLWESGLGGTESRCLILGFFLLEVPLVLRGLLYAWLTRPISRATLGQTVTKDNLLKTLKFCSYIIFVLTQLLKDI